MANSSVPITAGSGTNIDTWTDSDGHHRQAILIADKDTATAVAPVTAAGGLKVDLGADNDITMAVVSGRHVVAAASTNATNVKASAGTLRGFDFFNVSAVPIYLKFHNTAGTPTAGSGIIRTFGIQAGVRANVTIPGGGLAFATGIGITLVRDLADAGTTATAVNDAVGEIFYE